MDVADLTMICRLFHYPKQWDARNGLRFIVLRPILCITMYVLFFCSFKTVARDNALQDQPLRLSGTNTLVMPGTNVSCTWTKREDQAEVFWINLDRSTKRRKNMESLLNAMGLPHHRVRGYSLKEFHVPQDITKAVESARREGYICVPETAYDPSKPDNSSSSGSLRMPMGKIRKVFVKGACGSHFNTAKELVTVASHLLAMKEAVYSNTATSKYAVIMEDDVWTPFDIDFEELIETIPESDFGIIQLFNSKPLIASELMHRYKQIKYMWYPRPVAFDMRNLPSFSTGAYIINREVIKPIVDALIKTEADGWTSFTMLAGSTLPSCRPSVCCPLPEKPNDFVASLPNCVWAPVGYQADSFLYALAKTFVYSIPLFLDGVGSDESTIHQTHVIHQHRQSFRRIREFISQFLLKEIPLPHFIHIACPASVLQDPQEQLLKTV